MIRIGYHMSVAGGLDQAFDRGREIGCTAMQIFLSNPRGWEVKKPTKAEASEFSKKYKSYDILPVMAHMPYLPNLASPNLDVYKKSIKALKANVEIANELSVDYVVIHLGSHLGEGKSRGAENLINAVNAIGKIPKSVRILLENSVNHKNAVGAELGDLMTLYDGIINNSESIGFCIDTCHIFASGYDIRKVETLDLIGKEIGFEKIYALHINDSKYPLGSNRDRHENIGYGHIGIDGFRKFFSYGSISRKPLILETPYRSNLTGPDELEIIRKMINPL